MRDPCVCARSHGHSARKVATSSSRRAISPGRPGGCHHRGDVEGRQVVGFQRAVQVPPPDADDLLVGEAEVGEQHDVGRDEAVVGERRTA